MILPKRKLNKGEYIEQKGGKEQINLARRRIRNINQKGNEGGRKRKHQGRT